MDEILILNLIKSNLIIYRLDSFDLMKIQTQNQLIAIETYLQKCIDIYNNCISEIKKINLSVRGICNNSNIGKSTVYQNKDTLYTYIENRINEIESNYDIFSKKKITNLKNKNELLEQRLSKMIVDYIEMANIKIKIDDLYKENEKLKKQKDLLFLERTELIHTNNNLSLELTKLKNNVIDFPSSPKF